MTGESTDDMAQSVAPTAGHPLAECPSKAQGYPKGLMPLYRFADRRRRRGDLTGWRRAVDVALAYTHESHEQLYYRARAKLILGDWSGWTDYEARYYGPFFASQYTPLARETRWACAPWDGRESLEGKTLLVLNEQGFGDAIQMLRFLPTLVAQAGTVVLTVEPPLESLLSHNFCDVIALAANGDNRPVPSDRYAWSMTLPALIGGLPPFTPLSAPILRADQRPRRLLPLAAGICWAGSPHHPRDRERSMPIEAIASLVVRPDIEWYSLQVGERAVEAKVYSSLCRSPIELSDFADTASLIACLDFVVTVDTAVAHLAGSLGVPTYVLLPTAATWRWGLTDRTPWYPSMVLIRQSQPNDWTSAIRQVSSRIDDWLTAHRRPGSGNDRTVECAAR